MSLAIAFAESQDRSGSATNLAGVADLDMGVTVSGDNLRIPAPYNYVQAAYAWTSSSGYPVQYWEITQASIASNPWRSRAGNSASFESQIYHDWRGAAPRLATNEDSQVSFLEDDQAGTAHTGAVVLLMGKGPASRARYPAPQRFTHISSSTCSQLAAASLTWQSSTLTQLNDLPAGTYQITGVRLISNTAFAARLVIPGYNERPSFMPSNNEDEPYSDLNRWSGRFSFKAPDLYPSLEILANAQDTPSGFEMQLRKVA